MHVYVLGHPQAWTGSGTCPMEKAKTGKLATYGAIQICIVFVFIYVRGVVA